MLDGRHLLLLHLLELTLPAAVIANDRQDVNNFFAEFDELQTATPSLLPQDSLRARNYGRRRPPSPETRRFSKPGLFPPLQKKPGPLDKEPAPPLQLQQYIREAAPSERTPPNSFRTSQEKYFSKSNERDVEPERFYDRHRMRPIPSSRERVAPPPSGDGSNTDNAPDQRDLQSFRQRLVAGALRASSENIYFPSVESNADNGYVRHRKEKLKFLNARPLQEIRHPEVEEFRSNTGYVQMKNDNSDGNDRVNQPQPKPNQGQREASEDPRRSQFIIHASMPGGQNNENSKSAKEREESFLTDKDDPFLVSGNTGNSRTQSGDNSRPQERTSMRSGEMLLTNKNDLKQRSWAKVEQPSLPPNSQSTPIERSSKDSSETFLTDKDDPFLNSDYYYKPQKHIKKRPFSRDRSKFQSDESNSPDREYFPKKQNSNFIPSRDQNNRQNSAPRSEETFLTDREEYPGFLRKPQSRPSVVTGRPVATDRLPPARSSETFLTDEEDPPGLFPRPNEENSVQPPPSSGSGQTSSPTSDESFLTDEELFLPKRGSYKSVTLPPPASDENSVLDSDNFLTDNEPNPLPSPHLSRGQTPAKHLGRVRWPPPKGVEGDDSSSHEQPILKPLFYEDFRPSNQGFEQGRNNNPRRKGYERHNIPQESDEQKNKEKVYEEKNKLNSFDDERPPIYEDHHPLLAFEEKPATPQNQPTKENHEDRPIKKTERQGGDELDEEEEEDESEEHNKEESEEEDFPGIGGEESGEEQDSPANELDSGDHKSEETPHFGGHPNGPRDSEEGPPHPGHPNSPTEQSEEELEENNNDEESPSQGHGHEEHPSSQGHSHEEHPSGGHSHEEHPSGGHSHEEHPSDGHSHEEHPSDGHSHEEHTSGGHSHEEHPLGEHSHEENPSQGQSHEGIPPPDHSEEESPGHEDPSSANHVNSEEHPPEGNHVGGGSPPHSEEDEAEEGEDDDEEEHPSGEHEEEQPSEEHEGDQPSEEEEGPHPQDYDERPPDYDSIKPTPEYDEGGSHPEEGGSPEAGPASEPDYSSAPSGEDYTEGQKEPGSQGPGWPKSEEHSGEGGGENNTSPEFNFDSFEFPMDVMEPPPSSENAGSTTRRPTGSQRPTSLPADCPDGDEDFPTPFPVDLLKAKRPTGTAPPRSRPGDEVSITVAGPSMVKLNGGAGSSSTTTTARPVTISAIGVVKPGGEIIAKVVRPTSPAPSTAQPTSARPTLRSPRLRPRPEFGAKVKSSGSSTTVSPLEPWKAALAGREATALTYLKPPPLGQPQTWLQTAPPPSPMFRLFVV